MAKKSVVKSKCELYNDVLDLCDENFQQAEFSNALKLMKCLVDVLWHVDGNHEHIINKFAEKQRKGLPIYFNSVYNHTYNDCNKAVVKAKSKLSSELLLQYSDSLFDILSVWTNVSLPPAIPSKIKLILILSCQTQLNQ